MAIGAWYDLANYKILYFVFFTIMIYSYNNVQLLKIWYI